MLPPPPFYIRSSLGAGISQLWPQRTGRIAYSDLVKRQHRRRTMATARRIHVTLADSGILKFDQDDTTAAKVTELLQTDLESHHTFFNAAGFHNHLAHHLLALYGTGANVKALEKAYRDNATYQTRLRQPQPKALDELRADYASASSRYLGRGPQFPAFLAYFQEQMDEKGWQAVVSEYLFSETEASDDLFGRMFAGLLHPLIQLLYGIEWSQPAIVASALAQAAVHKNEMGIALAEAERLADERDSPSVPLITLVEEVQAEEHEKLRKSVRWGDRMMIADGVLTRARTEALEYASRVKVREEDLEERTAEMVHTGAYIAAANALNPPHVPKYDFYLIHHLNSAPIFLSINKLPWIPTPIKVRFLEWKLRFDILDFIARGSPPPQPNVLSTYIPNDEASNQTLVQRPEDLLPRFHAMDDDGHIIKVARSLLIAQQVTKPYSDRDWVRIKGEKEWLAAQYLLLDGAEGPGATWVRAAGFPEAWAGVPGKL